MSVVDDLVPLLKKLKLSGVLQTLELRRAQASDDNLSHADFLYRLLADEVERRDSKQLELRIRRAGFEHAKTLEDFDFLFNPGIPKSKVLDLADLLIRGLGSRMHCSSVPPASASRISRRRSDIALVVADTPSTTCKPPTCSSNCERLAPIAPMTSAC